VMYHFLTSLRYTRGQYEHEDTLADAEPPMCAEDQDCETPRSPLDLPLHRPSCIDNEYTDQTRNPKVLRLLCSGVLDKSLIAIP
jgi:hypothetical protein